MLDLITIATGNMLSALTLKQPQVFCRFFNNCGLERNSQNLYKLYHVTIDFVQ